MRLFVLFPYIYCRKTMEGYIFKDTSTNNTVLLNSRDAKLLSKSEQNLFEVNEINSTIVNFLISQNLGYIINSDIKPIYMQDVHFTSSKQRLYENSGYKDGRGTFDLIKKLIVYLDNNSTIIVNQNLANALDFPLHNDYDLSEIINFLNIHHCPNLQEIEIVSSISINTQTILAIFSEFDVLITYRTIIESINELIKINQLAELYPHVLFKLYIHINICDSLDKEFPYNVISYIWSTKIDEILKHDKLQVLPILYDIKTQSVLYNEMIYEASDISSINKSFRQLEYNSLFNSNFMGNITIRNNSVFVGPQKISSLNNFRKEYPQWCYDDSNLWYSTRRKKKICSSCLFADLCPPISIIEAFNIIDYPCNRSI